MNPQRFFIFIALIYFLLYVAHALFLNKTIYGDGIFYYSWLRSIVIDKDINFSNEYDYFQVKQPIHPSGLSGNKYSIGPALFWTPAFISVHSILKGTGYELPYQLAVGFTNVSLTLIGLLLLFDLLRKFFNERIVIAVVACVALATNLLFYGAIDPVNTHALTFFAATVYLTLLFKKKPRFLLVGATLGIMALLRPQDGVYSILAFSTLFKETPLQRSLLFVRLLIIGFLLAFLPQLLAWKALYGSFLANPYLIEGQTFNFLQPKILEVLFSLNHGLFLWTPILFLSFIGLLLYPKPYTLSPRAMLLVIALQIYIVSSWFMWWQGESYSGRMFVSLLPLFAFGLAHLFSCFRSQKMIPYIAGGFSLLNAALIVYFLL